MNHQGFKAIMYHESGIHESLGSSTWTNGESPFIPTIKLILTLIHGRNDLNYTISAWPETAQLLHKPVQITY